MIRSLRLPAALVLSTVFIPAASAAVFPDVPDGHMFQTAVEQLHASGVVNGNPDGTFAPNRAVNRAELLKMLYLAKGRTPDRASVRCFPDVIFGSWYESYVCDAASRSLVGGYPDGTFKPSQSVNRVEALKMIQLVMDISVEEVTDTSRSIVNFIDVSTAAWYTKYLANAYAVGILPIPGQEQSRFYPEKELTRGEAAAMIYNAQNASIRIEREESQEQERASSSNSSARSSEASSSVASTPVVTVPFDERGKFSGKSVASYQFSLQKTTTISISGKLQSNQQGRLSCVVQRLDEEGFVYEYYIGVEHGTSCNLLVALEPGSYQLALQPGNPDTTYQVTGTVSTSGDDNDGFSQAKPLKLNVQTTATIAPNNTANWYHFSVNEGQGKRMKIELSDAGNFICMVYPLDDVDVYGFELPQCNQYYTFPSGSYRLGIYRAGDPSVRLTYTLILRE